MDLYAIWSERNNAVRECNMAVAEKRQAMADRDIAMLQRDAAFADRDNAMMQRDNAIAQLQLKTNTMNASSGVMVNPSESGVSVSQRVKEIPMVQKQQQQRRQHIVNYSEIAFKPVEVPFSDVYAQSTNNYAKSTKVKKGKCARETKAVSSSKSLKPTREIKAVSSNKASKPVKETKAVTSSEALKPTRKISKRGRGTSNKQVTVACLPSSENGLSGKSGNLEKQVSSKGGLNELGLDYDSLPVPFCSCTGNPQSCYKWGKGGWQSACCTTTLSMYPLPQMPNKRHSRVGGRKMSGGAFTKLITRLASEGHNVTAPIDLKDRWAKHGTNRYIIIR